MLNMANQSSLQFSAVVIVIAVIVVAVVAVADA
jgi:hypothetical protein